MSWLTVSTLRKTVKNVTRQERLWLRQESFELMGAQICIENESLTIDFDQFGNDFFTIRIFDKELQKSVSLDFCDDSEIDVWVFFYKEKRTLAFWKKPVLQIEKSIHTKVDDQDEEKNENIKFVWDRIPEFLINLR